MHTQRTCSGTDWWRQSVQASDGGLLRQDSQYRAVRFVLFLMALFICSLVNILGAIFFAVCRGKVSEGNEFDWFLPRCSQLGIDFANRNGRAVILVSLPYPSHVDAKVNLKKKYLDETFGILILPCSFYLKMSHFAVREQAIAQNKPKLIPHPSTNNNALAGRTVPPSATPRSLSGAEWYGVREWMLFC
jgi:hypothetical protein